ncbi:hypothetical protein H5410_049178 [Solanum commersonii]|uniref:Uncharacterized protein n=1 Tax=Solanum commersonii TaxID=4109 RepID=A0A9J5XNT3_SOLCO|nr:hypothetical protein H5410_049178 [Solanum commersonii]
MIYEGEEQHAETQEDKFNICMTSTTSITGRDLFIIFRGIRWTMPGRTSDVLTSWNAEEDGKTNNDRWRVVSAVIWWTI